MERLSGLDASFLYLETPAQLMHVCGLLVVDPSTIPGGYDFESFRQEMNRRVRDVPGFTRKVRRVPLDLDHPVWVRDEEFSIRRHVHRAALPAPGGYEQLTELVGHLAGIPLDRSRPLWDCHIIEGLEDGRLGIFTKIHHSTVDGASGGDLVAHLCSLQPDEPPLAPPPPERFDEPPTDRRLLGDAVVGLAGRPVKAARLVPPSARLIGNWLQRARSGTAMAAPLTAPRTSFNGTITGHRIVGWTGLDLELVKRIKNAADATVNDVVLAVAGGALRAYLQRRGELPATSLLATVPVSVRGRSRRQVGANKVSALFTHLETQVEDPLERLAALVVHNRDAKEQHQAVEADTLQDWAEFAAPRTFGLAVRTYAALRLAEHHPVVHNLVISNVPGPPMPLYYMGALIEGYYPLGPVFHGAGLNITVLSNNGLLHVGVIACEEQMPDLQALVEEFPAELERLRRAAGVRKPRHRARRTAAGS